MARILFVVPPMTGHIQPTLAVGDELIGRGHRCAWVGHEEVLGPMLHSGLGQDRTLLPLGEAPTHGSWGEELARIREQAQRVRGLAGLKFLWEDVLIPLAHAMLPGVRSAAHEFGADLLVVDQQAFAGALIARERGCPWATLATTSADRQRSLHDLPRVLAWTEDRLAALQSELGLEPVACPEDSPHCVLVFSTPDFVGDVSGCSPQTRFVGPALSSCRPPVDFPMHGLKDVPRILVTLGTLNSERGTRLFRALADAVGDMHLQVILAAPDNLGPFPENFIVRPYLPLLELMPKVDAVLCHGGHNTVCEALSFAKPLIVAPIKDDQPVVAAQVVDAGVGLRLSFGRPRAAHIRSGVQRVLHENCFAQAAQRIQASFVAAGGAPRAADHLEGLLR